jgi:PAS domain S-box-containing protein
VEFVHYLIERVCCFPNLRLSSLNIEAIKAMDDINFRLPSTNEMPEFVRAKDWSASKLGPRDRWSPSLQMALEIVLASAFPMALRWGPDFILLYNDGYKVILGEKHPWALGRPAQEVWPEVWDQIEPIHNAILNGRQKAIFAEDTPMRIQRNLGTWDEASFTLSYSPAPDSTAPSGIGGIVVTALETTRRVATERRLREVQSALEREVGVRTRERDRLWQNSQDLLSVLDTNGVVREASPGWTRILGWTSGEIVGHRHVEFVHPDDRPASEDALSHAHHETLPAFENRLLHKDGGYRWVSWVAAREAGLIYASGRHVTAEKAAAAELAVAQDALRQSQKMEAIGQLTGGIAHDFNNMLAIVIGSLDLANRRLQRGDAAVGRYLESANEGARRAATLTQRLLAFSRQSQLAPQAIGLNSLVASMSELLQRTLGERIDLETALAAGLWPAHVDPNQLESAVLNLAVNARDAMPDGGRLVIATANVELNDRHDGHGAEVAPGQYVMIAVSDGGTGMPVELLQKVFDPFFTTKPVGKGTGLGLSMVYGFARQSGGHVRIESEPGHGTTVKIYLPRYFGSLATTKETTRPHNLLPAGSSMETVLIVEDEERVRHMSIDALLELGYTVYAAASGEEALTVFANVDRIDILFTDVVMAGMTGRQLADALRLKCPGLKVLYTTGYTRNAVVHNGALDPGMAFLPKPFSVGELALKLRAVLDG